MTEPTEPKEMFELPDGLLTKDSAFAAEQWAKAYHDLKDKKELVDGKETVSFIPSSELDISEDGWENINNSQVTFGHANRTLYTAERILQCVDFDEDEDREIFEELDPLTYIDLEN